jgi:hypothetical protein
MTLTDADVLTFVLAGCSVSEVAEYTGWPDFVAKGRMAFVFASYQQAALRATQQTERAERNRRHRYPYLTQARVTP